MEEERQKSILQSLNFHETITGQDLRALLVFDNLNEHVAKELIKKFLRPIRTGTFQMGVDDGKVCYTPKHFVELDGFSISDHETTVLEYCLFLNYSDHSEVEDWVEFDQIEFRNNKFHPRSGKEYEPISSGTWFGAVAYAEWLGCRLPTEAEWEYAAKGGDHSRVFEYSGSDNHQEVAWFSENSDGSAHIIASKKCNEIGLFDMSGNVKEWCNDWYSCTYYRDSPSSNPNGPFSGNEASTRGGSFMNSEVPLKVTSRWRATPETKDRAIGFRIASDTTY